MNWFRRGLFAPVTEEVTAFDLPVTGRIPSELNGHYLRNGPNFMRGIDDSKHHWFLASGMVHGVRFGTDGRSGIAIAGFVRKLSRKRSAKSGGRVPSMTTTSPPTRTFLLTLVESLPRWKMVPCHTRSPTN